MASPSPATAAVIKVEDEENLGVRPGRVPSEQELRNKFWEDVKRRAELKKRGLCTSGSAQPPPPPPPPVQPPPPPPPAHQPWAKRPATVPPPGLAGVRQPPRKLYQRRPPGQRASAQPQQPAPNACRALALPPAHAAGPDPVAVPQTLQRRPAPPKPPRHPAAKKKPTVPCAFCGVLCMTAWHLEQHEKGRKHRNRVAYLAGETNVRCPVCDVHPSGALNVEQHFAGKQHIWRLKLS
ncbi:hypothetical protein C2845_PM01G39110 [Panicum miliaceum]|uniref:C2H2-type domain-containing protein n=1 Tax=Panicum miliaceum TaxID=4540 RepID=A0A3L6TS19_PANMI|nr:hypothetical protein C2845_PM01G39110 [Panicum miliaceum]